MSDADSPREQGRREADGDIAQALRIEAPPDAAAAGAEAVDRDVPIPLHRFVRARLAPALIRRATTFASLLQGRMGVLGCEPQDLVNEAVLRLLGEEARKRGHLDQDLHDRGVTFEAALWTTIRRVAAEMRRTRSRRFELSVPVEEGLDLPQKEAGPSALAESDEDAAAVRAAILQLPPKSRELVVLHYFLGLTPEEIAKRTGMRPSSVHSTLTRARKMLERALRRSVNRPASE